MMRSAHSPTPPAAASDGNDMPETEEFDDPYEAMSSSNLEDLALGSDDGEGSDNDNAAGSAPAAASATEEADPWAVLAAAAGEEAPPTTTAAETAAPATVPVSTTAAAVDPSIASAVEVQPTLAHAEGETFSMPTDSSSQPPSLVAQIQSSTANLLPTLQTKIAEIDDRTGISTRAKDVDSQYHIAEKWSNFQNNVMKPTVDNTVTKTKEVSGSVKEKVGPSVKEGWGSIKQRTVEMGVAEKWSSLSSVVGSKWNETKETVGESVERLKEEQERKKAVANANPTNNERAMGGSIQLEGAKEKVVESWTGGMNWVNQRIQNVKLQQQQQQNGGMASSRDKEMSRLDSDGLPTSFRKDEF